MDLLYLTPNHVHLYMESDGELSIEKVVNEIKLFSNNAVLEKVPFLKNKLSGDIEIWDVAYFVETIG